MTPSELALFPTFREMEVDYLARLLEACEGNVTLAAKVSCLGRATLYRKAVELGLKTSGAMAREVRQTAKAQLDQAWSELRQRPARP